ncbi:MAG TPA: nitrile hydratase subunit beta [Burkholderiales bacterium]|jgi:nitrile hydratase|nr:nitrile hydratase subunit beta [Burkholderiales bacterium]
MNGAHDLGGMHGFGPVGREENEPVFHHEWERRAFALTLASAYAVRWNIDMTRYAREQMPPAEYLATSYYEHWLFGLQKLLFDLDVLAPGELASGHAAGRTNYAPLAREQVRDYLGNPRNARLDADVPPKFKVGDRVLTHNAHPIGHTRLPRYARGRYGVIDRDHGVFVFADTNAMTRDKKPQHCYSVRFAARELWGPAASPRDAVYLDLWDDHLDPA